MMKQINFTTAAQSQIKMQRTSVTSDWKDSPLEKKAGLIELHNFGGK